jgi:hypothetical protein
MEAAAMLRAWQALEDLGGIAKILPSADPA